MGEVGDVLRVGRRPQGGEVGVVEEAREDMPVVRRDRHLPRCANLIRRPRRKLLQHLSVRDSDEGDHLDAIERGGRQRLGGLRVGVERVRAERSGDVDRVSHSAKGAARVHRLVFVAGPRPEHGRGEGDVRFGDPLRRRVSEPRDGESRELRSELRLQPREGAEHARLLEAPVDAAHRFEGRPGYAGPSTASAWVGGRKSGSLEETPT